MQPSNAAVNACTSRHHKIQIVPKVRLEERAGLLCTRLHLQLVHFCTIFICGRLQQPSLAGYGSLAIRNRIRPGARPAIAVGTVKAAKQPRQQLRTLKQ